MSTWKTFPLNIPDDREEVWVRVKYYYSTPFLAEFGLATKTFISTVNAITYPVWVIARWRSQ
jgi:hypothetical protein